MRKVLVLIFGALVVVSISATSDAFAQSGGRRGADVRCRHGGTVQGKWYCNLKHAPPGPWNNYQSTGRYKQRI
jgi:hypothetical protein